jgi:hypothetical protein
MPRFILPGARELSCADDEGRAYLFKFPVETDSPTKTALLLKHGAVIEKLKFKPIEKPEPIKPEPVKEGGEK